MEIAHTISACARAHEAGGERFAERVKAVGLRVNALAVGLRGAHRARGTVPRRSHRHGALRAHERQVIGALRKAEGMLDTDPRQGLRELAEMLLTMAERYAEGRTGALLDADRLTGIDPVPDRTVLRMISAGVLVTAAAVSVTFLGLPGAAEPYAITGLGLVVFTVVFGRQARRAFDILDAIRGGPRVHEHRVRGSPVSADPGGEGEARTAKGGPSSAVVLVADVHTGTGSNGRSVCCAALRACRRLVHAGESGQHRRISVGGS